MSMNTAHAKLNLVTVWQFLYKCFHSNFLNLNMKKMKWALKKILSVSTEVMSRLFWFSVSVCLLNLLALLLSYFQK